MVVNNVWRSCHISLAVIFQTDPEYCSTEDFVCDFKIRAEILYEEPTFYAFKVLWYSFVTTTHFCLYSCGSFGW